MNQVSVRYLEHCIAPREVNLYSYALLLKRVVLLEPGKPWVGCHPRLVYGVRSVQEAVGCGSAVFRAHGMGLGMALCPPDIVGGGVCNGGIAKPHKVVYK